MDSSCTSAQGKIISESVAIVLPPKELNPISSKEIQRKMDDGEELGASAACLGEIGESRSSELVVYSEKTQVTNEENFSKSSSKICHQINRKRNFNATKPVGEELNQEDVPVSKKRDRRPNTQLKFEEGYDYSWLCPKESSSKLVCRKKKAAVAKRTLKRRGAELIGCRVKIWWKLDRKYYSGKVTAFNRFQKLHRIDYDDGEKELLDLSKEIWKLVGDEELSNVEEENGAGPSSSTAAFGKSGICLSHSSKRKNKVAKVPNTSRNFGLYLIGRRVKVWWPLDQTYYRGKIIGFKAFQRLHQIEYDDGDKEILDLSKELWKLIGDEVFSSGEQDNSGLRASTAVFGNSGISLSHPSKRKNQAASEEMTTRTDKNKKDQSIRQKAAPTALKMMASRTPNSQKQKNPVDGSSSTLIQDGKTGTEYINVNGYEVSASLAPVLRAIFAKYGDICSPSTIKNQKMRCSLLEVACNVVKKLQSTDFGLITSEVKEMMSDISDLVAVKMDISWLQKHLEELEQVKEIGQSSSYLIDLEANSDLVVKAARKDAEDEKLKSISAKKNFKKAKSRLEALKVVRGKIKDNIAAYVATKNAWQKSVDELI